MSFTFGAKPAAGSGSLFGNATTTSSSLFGSSTTGSTTTSGSTVFGGSASNAPSLFGGGASGGTSLFGSTTTATATSAAPSLFGGSSTTTAGTAATTAPTTTTLSLGLGGTAPSTGLSTTPGFGTATTGASAEKETVREGIVPKPIREVAIQLREKLKENRKLTEEFNSNSTDMTVKIKDQIKDVEHKLCEVYSKTADCDMRCAQLSRRIAKDIHLGDIAQRVQESVNKNVHVSSHTQVIEYMVDIIREYDECVNRYQDVVEDISRKLDDALNGKVSHVDHIMK
ncbi:unnamed protein product [Nippostrongylus brasiliensis]|uniref:Nucleoporin p58/p45 n=1 Tax=Nippostrongylus brasiliensis TaxID=27835 RepID=A0A0N4YVG6_NIPBR|nr:unnamed protein product [Nippostrongylus brasiliensis]